MSEAHVVWPSVCDLCEEHVDTPEHCAHCGHRLRPVESQRAPRPAPTRTFTSFPSAMADRRAEHRRVLAELARWSLTEGRHVDLDVAALCLDVLERQRTPHGIHLDRRKVNGIMWASIPSEASIAGTLLPERWIEDLWTALRFVIATGRPTADSDPEAALLEPLQCYGGLGTDGRPRPHGVDVGFFCQCRRPHDPTCPPGMVQVSVGHDRDEPFEFVAHAHGIPRSVDVPMSAYGPLAKLARRHRAQPSMFTVALDQFDHLGTVPAEGRIPQLWLYLFAPTSRRAWPPLALDAHGGAWGAERHRGRRRGFCWKPVDDRSAAHRCGLASWEFERIHRERDQLGRWDDDGPLGSCGP